MRKEVPDIEFMKGILGHLIDDTFIDTEQRHVIVFDELMTEAKCDLFTKGSNHIILLRTFFPRGKPAET